MVMFINYSLDNFMNSNNLQKILISKQEECAKKYNEYHEYKYKNTIMDTSKDPILLKYGKVKVDTKTDTKKLIRKYNDLIKMFYCGIDEIKLKNMELDKIKNCVQNINKDSKLYCYNIGTLISYCDKKYNEYIFCKYGYDFNIYNYAGDTLIQNYNVIRFNYDELVKQYKEMIQEFDDVIEEKIRSIGRGQLYTEQEWIILANHRYNNKYDYSKVKYINAQTKVIIICRKHKIEYLQYPHSHLSGYECTKCTKELRGTLIPFEKSFASHEKSKYWSKKNKLRPENVPIPSKEKYFFDCPCNHEIIITLGDVQAGYWCAYCATKKVCSEEDCESCFNNSFAPHEKAIYWSDLNDCTPRNVLKSTKNTYFFNCDICGHVLNMKLNNVNNGAWCVYCAHKKLCDKDCNFCFENSFASSNLSKYWSKKNNIEPRMCFKNSSYTKYIFDCPHCNSEYISSLDGVSRGYWCDCIKYKTETKIFNFLKLNYGQIIEKQKKFDWCKNKKHLPFDFFIEDYKLIIECDGAQHFRAIHKWKDPKLTQERDKYKMDCANNMGYSVIRIYQEDVWADKNNWGEKLKSAIKYYDIPTNVYIGDVYEGVYFNCNK